MLDDLERDDRTKAAILKRRQVERGAKVKLEVRPGIVQLAVLNGQLVDVDSHDMLRRLRQERCAKALPASQIEHPASAN